MELILKVQSKRMFLGLKPETVDDAKYVADLADRKGVDFDAAKDTIFLDLENVVASCNLHNPPDLDGFMSHSDSATEVKPDAAAKASQDDPPAGGGEETKTADADGDAANGNAGAGD